MREYPYTKSILLNVVYVMLERLAFPLMYVNSRSGVLRFGYGAVTGEMDLTAIIRDGEEITRVEISDTGQELSLVIFDEIASILQQNFGQGGNDE
ncbi:MAG: hypothetical protein IKE40_01825 [Firmicutes bacterium]|nr:hypothetical protein [Bacillota bacterium]